MIVHTFGIPAELLIERNMWKSRVAVPKNYDPKKLTLEDMTQDGGMYVGYDQSLTSGRRVRAEGLPIKVIWWDKRLVPDFEIIHSPTMIVSQRFRDVVEAVEPGVHQFEPVEYVTKQGAHVADMFVFVICNRIDSVDRDLTTQYRLHPVGNPTTSKSKYWQPSIQGTQLVFNAAQVGDHHLWVDKYLPDYKLVSSAFVDAACAAGLVGVSFRAWETV